MNLREVLNAIFYVLATGCQWQALPKDLPPKSTAHHYFMLWDWDGTLERIHDALYVAAREAAGREASPTAAIIDSQTAKAAQKGAPRSTRKAIDAGKKVTGRKRHILVDTLGLLLGVSVLPADIQDRDGARDLLQRGAPALSVHRAHLRRRRISRAENGEDVAATGCWKIEIVKRSDLHRFVVLPKRWIVERTLRLDQPQSTSDPRFRTLRHNRRRLRSPRHDPPHAQTPDQAKPLLMNPFFLDRL